MAGRYDAAMHIEPYDFGAALGLERELGVSHTLAQILARRGLDEPEQARAWLEAEDEHPPSAFAGIGEAVDLILRHAKGGWRITVHGDYDVDGVCSSAILLRCLRRLGADVDWYLPSRIDDGYGLSPATVERLAARGTNLLITVDCAITAVEEVAAARAAGMEVVVTDHHQRRADGMLPEAPIVHPEVCGYPCPDLCATGVAYKLALALEEEAGGDGRAADGDLDLVALATVADCVPLRGENRRLVREGLRALAHTAKPGLRALMEVAQLDPGLADAHSLGFRLAPRINAAGRLYRADAGLELVTTEDEARAGEIARELDRVNGERRDVETRILFEAEAQIAELGRHRVAHVLAAEGWHPGVVGIVASRLAERHHRPVVMIALDGDTGTGSCRSIPAYDVLSGLTAAASHLQRHGGHRAAAGLEIRREDVAAFRGAFEHHVASTLAPGDLIPVQRVDAMVPGDALTLTLAEELERLAPFGIGNAAPTLMVSAATVAATQAMGEGKHLRFDVEAGGARSRGVAFGAPGGRFPVDATGPVDAAFSLERNHWNGAVEPRLLLRCAAPSHPLPVNIVGEPEDFREGVRAELRAPLESWPPAIGPPAREVVDRREAGIAGTIADLAATGQSVLVVCADVGRRIPGLRGRLGGFALCSYAGLERRPDLADEAVHVVALDPPAHAHQHALLLAAGGGYAHLAWGDPELRFARQIHELEFGLREPLAALYRTVRDHPIAGDALERALRGESRPRRSASLAGRLLRILSELALVELDEAAFAVSAPEAQHTDLERSPAFRAYRLRHEDGLRWLSGAKVRAAA